MGQTTHLTHANTLTVHRFGTVARRTTHRDNGVLLGDLLLPIILGGTSVRETVSGTGLGTVSVTGLGTVSVMG